MTGNAVSFWHAPSLPSDENSARQEVLLHTKTSSRLSSMDDLQVIAEPRRREILGLIWGRERSAGEIAAHFEVTFGAVSQHLGILRDHGFVNVRTDGSRRLYRADLDGLGELRAVLESMWGDRLDELAHVIEVEE